MYFRNLSLEMSLKPFKDPSDEAVRAVARKLFTQWLPLARHSEQLSVMLWAADGSEILDYRGNAEDEFEWACWIGGANPRLTHPGDSQRVGLHSRCYPYVDDPPRFTYGWLRRLNAILKQVGREVAGRPVRIGATFDPGPEFARSPFKYERHNEICASGTMGFASFVTCYATLDPDDVAYAAFPEGIPAGTTVGTFLGAQTQRFLSDLDFDYIWLSNGFGFGMETWALTGAVFDGRSFSSDRCEEVRDKILGFWNDFRAQCPDFPVETRGTNLSTGMDLSSDAVPLREIYRGSFHMEPPPNSPWAALNGDFGLELIGWMAHIAELPSDSFPFRFYTHDPWWANSPWLDRYGREPHDLYLPLSVARLDTEAAVNRPTSINFLSIDDSWGKMPEIVPREVTAHLLDAWETGPDRAGPLVWVYPFDEYHDMTYGQPSRIDEVFFGDWYMRGAVDCGLPLNTVISTRSFASAAKTHPERLARSILISPIPDPGTDWERGLLAHLTSGGDLLLYGPLTHAGQTLLETLNLARAEPLEGEFALTISTTTDLLPKEQLPDKLIHPGLFSAGGIDARLANNSDPHTRTLATVTRSDQTRTIALHRTQPDWNGGAVAWVRGTVACDPEKIAGHLLTPYGPDHSYPAEALMRQTLSSFGCDILFEKKTGFGPILEMATPDQRFPLTCIARHANAFYFSGYVPDTTARLHLKLPQGAPLLLGCETELVDGRATYHQPRAWRRECRLFVEQQSGQIGLREFHPSTSHGIRRRFVLSGLDHARLRFFHVPGSETRVTILREPAWPYIEGDFLEFTHKNNRLGDYLELEDVSGSLMISW